MCMKEGCDPVFLVVENVGPYQAHVRKDGVQFPGAEHVEPSDVHAGTGRDWFSGTEGVGTMCCLVFLV